MDEIEKTARFGSAPEWAIIAPGGQNSTDPLDAAKGVRSESILIFDAFDTAVTMIAADADLTVTGKKKRLAEIGKSSLESMAKQRLRLAPVSTAHGQAVSKARAAAKSPEDKIADLLMQGEIRRLLAEQTSGDPIQVKIAYQDALAAGDFTTADAIENSPMLWAGRPDADTLDQWRADRLEVEEPTLSAEVRYLSAALKDCGNILDDVESEIREAASIPAEDGIQALANADVGAQK